MNYLANTMLKCSTTRFFATRQDWIPGLELVLAELRVRFVPSGVHTNDVVPMYSLLDWKDLGRSLYGDQAREPTFFIIPSALQFSLTSEHRRDNNLVYKIDLGKETTAVEFRPAGVFNDMCLISGHLSADSTQNSSIDLYSIVAAQLFRSFVKIGSYLVGPSASEMLHRGTRLTYHVQAPAEYALSIEVADDE